MLGSYLPHWLLSCYNLSLLSKSLGPLTTANQRELVAHEAPQKQPHFHAKIHTTDLQPETPLSANSEKIYIS